MNRHAPRPRIQRAFVHWLERNQSRFLIPIRIKSITAGCLEIAFVGITSAISASLLGKGALLVPVDWNGTTWDFLLWLDAAPINSVNGYVCTSCEPEQRTVFRDRESLWRDHLFEPFLHWVNTRLAPAKWLALHGAAERSTAAALLTERAPPLDTGQTCISVRDER